MCFLPTVTIFMDTREAKWHAIKIYDPIKCRWEKQNHTNFYQRAHYGPLEHSSNYKGIRARVNFIPWAADKVISLLDSIKEDLAACAARRLVFRCIVTIKAIDAGIGAIKQHFPQTVLQDGVTPWPRQRNMCEAQPFILKKQRKAWPYLSIEKAKLPPAVNNHGKP